MCKTVPYIKKYDVIISFHSPHFVRDKFYFRRKKEAKQDTEKEQERMVEGELGKGDRKKLRELRRSYEILNSQESFHITAAVNAGRQAGSRLSKTTQYVQKAAMVMH
jgi:hypothetical protein